MTSTDLEKLTKAAVQLNHITGMLAEDPEVPEAMLALLTAASGCFTTLVHVADLLTEIHAGMLLSKLSTKREVMQ